MQKFARQESMPHVFSLQLAWESQTESADAIVGTLDAMVAEEVDLGAARVMFCQTSRAVSAHVFHRAQCHADLCIHSALGIQILCQPGCMRDVVKACSQSFDGLGCKRQRWLLESPAAALSIFSTKRYSLAAMRA